ncbi:MAG: glycine--tRNA ligase subunit beta [Elusimicrobia bacterium]|nr:glycine--tRNA ligase subunit beta [Elusimicrobiota bacterium]
MKESPGSNAMLEIGTEEIPAAYVPPALSFMRSFAEEFLRSKRLPVHSVQSLGTPKRLSLLLFGLPAKSDDSEEELWGPPLKVSKDANQRWTQAALGFAQSHQVSLDDVSIRVKKDAEYICVVKKHPGQKSEKIVRELFTALIPAIPFPKKMVWDSSYLRFARPVRNLVALFDNHTLRVQAGHIKSSNKTFALPHLSAKKITIASPQNYANTLRNHCVLVDPAARQETILRSCSQLAARVSGQADLDEKLLSEVVWLVEHPVSVLCSFDPKFLELPREVLVTCMKKQQKFFPVLSAQGNLLPFFIAVRNGISEHQESVRKGYEKVLHARLSDARFFFEEDLKKPLESYVSKCSGISLQENLGSLNDKTERMKSMARFFLDCLEKDGPLEHLDSDRAERAIHLSKFDLATHMVYEFPELQGIMGEIYAARRGEDSHVASAIREHYYPLTAQSGLPTAPLSSLVALLDRMDNLVGNILVGHVPSGHSDPYGLRRLSSGILRILLENEWDISLRELTKVSCQQISAMRVDRDSKESNGPGPERNGGAMEQVLNFFSERFQLLMEDKGFKADEIAAVVKNPTHLDSYHLRVSVLSQKIAALRGARNHPDFESVTLPFKRLANILKQAKTKNILYAPQMFNMLLLKEKEEIDLHAMTNQLLKKTGSLLQQKKYAETLGEWVVIRESLNQFFEKVLVMDPDVAICVNRLSLLSILESLFKEIADFSQLQNPAPPMPSPPASPVIGKGAVKV